MVNRLSAGTGASAAPIVAPSGAGAVALAGLRIVIGLLWLYNVVWKLPPDFGKSGGNGLYGFTRDAVDHPVFPPYSWVVEHLVLPNFTAFGWAVLVVETLLAVLLLTGTFVRLAALVGIGQSLAIGLSVARAPGEWPWSYVMLIAIHVVLLFTAAGRVAAVDAVRHQSGEAKDRATPLLRGWGVIMVVVGLVAVALAVAADPFASAGANVGYGDLEVSLGRYNVVGALGLLVVGALMVAASTTARPALALAAAAIATLAALSLYVQLTRYQVWLGGTNTSAAFFLCAAVVSAATANALGRRREAPQAAHG